MEEIKVFLGLGSNLGDKKKILNEAVKLLQENGFTDVRLSSFFETVPINCPQGSEDFVNAVVCGQWADNADNLLALLHEIELKFGRHRTIKNAPRSIDLDILIFGSEIIKEKYLIVPHPCLKERRFVLEPLAELAPNLRLPNENYSIAELLNNLVN